MACPYVVLNELGNAVDLYTPNLMLFSSDPSTKTPAKGDNMAEFKSGQYVVASLSGDWGGLEDAEEVSHVIAFRGSLCRWIGRKQHEVRCV
jgi:hypothetical protein